MITQGIHPNITNSDYHADYQFITNSSLQLHAQCPAKLKYSREHPSSQTEAMSFGEHFHFMMEYGTEAFKAEYGRIIEGNGATKAVKESKSAIIQAGRIPLKPDVHDSLLAMYAEVEKHPAAGDFLRASGRNELTIATRDPETGMLIKSRADKLTDNGVMVDWKTTVSAAPNDFSKSVSNFGYHRQAAFYMDCAKHAGVEVNKFIFVCVEKTAPYLVAVYELDETAIRLARELNNKALSDYAICLERGEWRGYSQNIESLSLPNWVYAAAARGSDEY